MKAVFDAQKRRFVGAALGLFAVIALTGAGQLVAKDSELRLKARLTGAAITGKTPEGSADFRSQTGRTRLNVEVEHVNLADGTVLDVTLTHAGVATVIGHITLALGGGELELESEHGAIVPAVQKGDVVTVANAGAAIVVGSF
jgi:hypothetical protein